MGDGLVLSFDLNLSHLISIAWEVGNVIIVFHLPPGKSLKHFAIFNILIIAHPFDSYLRDFIAKRVCLCIVFQDFPDIGNGQRHAEELGIFHFELTVSIAFLRLGRLFRRSRFFRLLFKFFYDFGVYAQFLELLQVLRAYTLFLELFQRLRVDFYEAGQWFP